MVSTKLRKVNRYKMGDQSIAFTVEKKMKVIKEFMFFRHKAQNLLMVSTILCLSHWISYFISRTKGIAFPVIL